MQKCLQLTINTSSPYRPLLPLPPHYLSHPQNTPSPLQPTSVASSFSPNSRSALAGVAGRPRSVSASTTTTTSPQQQSISTSPSSSSHPSPQLQSVASPLSSLSKSPSRTPAQFSLQSIFIRFVHAAELKVDALVYSSTSVTDSDLSVPLRSGVDPEFDGLLCGLGSVAKHCPKLIIDCVMVWRKSKSEKSADDVPANM
ncbi:hypothetical protein BC829DRAFT_251919 [Chytridium lagenaria]|nr:hypothetical protein BC829DRAFT_251919 [Chytridium lagenaria]